LPSSEASRIGRRGPEDAVDADRHGDDKWSPV
jgi:hypothetical protein